ncbi:MAG TPA: HAD hydrolase-like protein [Candidatus Paceibacterota bacterium]|nr:HAD hydrolase-like protein [Verrucomicrobiota bacterium]HRY51274.1 HAD hydrolase-like protein [Candidatus Paceibacterota bacterium]HSA00577.1 HAD hydrolase-like protein [Candidatus Paceibacterota bacterium]
MIKAIFFDIDGTLVHTGRAGVKAFDRAFATEFNIPNGTENLVFAGRTDPSIVRDFFKKHGIDPSPAHFKRFFESYVFWLDHLLPKSQGGICPGVWNFIHDSQSLQTPPLLGLLTGNIRLGAEIKLRHFFLWESFAVGAFGDDHENRNELAGIALDRARKVLGGALRPDEVLIVGDTPLDIECARSIQAQSLAVATGASKLEQLQVLKPTWAVAHLGTINARQVCL